MPVRRGFPPMGPFQPKPRSVPKYPKLCLRQTHSNSVQLTPTKLMKIGAKVVRHGRMVTFQMAKVAISKEVWAEMLSRIERLRWSTA